MLPYPVALATIRPDLFIAYYGSDQSEGNMATIIDNVAQETRDFSEYPFHVADALV